MSGAEKQKREYKTLGGVFYKQVTATRFNGLCLTFSTNSLALAEKRSRTQEAERQMLVPVVHGVVSGGLLWLCQGRY